MRRTSRPAGPSRLVARSLAAALAFGTVAASPAGVGLVTGDAAAAASAGASAGAAAGDPGYEPDELLVTWAPATTGFSRQSVGDRFGGFETLATSELTGTDVVELAPGEDPLEVAAELADDPRVAHVQPNFRYQRATTNDPNFWELWGLHNTGQTVEGTTGTADVDLDVPEAWTVTRGVPAVTVAVIDSGIDVSHPDLAPNLWVNGPERDGRPGVDDDGNGYVDDVHGWDFRNDDASLFDATAEDAHGTHVAGVIAAAADNGEGVAGVAPRVRIMPLKFLGADSGTTADAIRAIEYATAKGVRIINASWGSPSDRVDEALNAAIEASGAVFVAAAGNGGGDWKGDDTDVTPWSPASLPAANIVTVAAVDATGALGVFSNYGATSVDVAAPGVRSLSTYPGGRYGVGDGTSMAAPHVAGVAALVAARDPRLSGGQIATLLRQAAERNPLPALRGRTVTGGMPNARTAVDLAGGATGGTRGPSDASRPPARTAPSVKARGLAHACPTVAPARFPDVAAGNPHAPGIACAVAWQVFEGGSSGFAPGAELRRGQLASVLARAIERATGEALAANGRPFRDTAGSVHADAIAQLAAIDVVGGISAGRYGPAQPVTRAQFAAMLARTYRHLAGTLPTGTDAFLDDDGNAQEASIDALAGLGIVTGDGRGSYGPGAELTRGQAATMVARLLDALVDVGAARR